MLTVQIAHRRLRKHVMFGAPDMEVILLSVFIRWWTLDSLSIGLVMLSDSEGHAYST